MVTPFLARFHAKKKTRVAQMHRTISGQENITYSSPDGLTPDSLLLPPLPSPPPKNVRKYADVTTKISRMESSRNTLFHFG